MLVDYLSPTLLYSVMLMEFLQLDVVIFGVFMSFLNTMVSGESAIFQPSAC